MKPSPGPPSPSQPNQPSPSESPVERNWFDRHFALSILLQILAIPILGAVSFFLWIFEEQKYSISVGILLIVLVAAMIRAPDHNALGQAYDTSKPPHPRP